MGDQNASGQPDGGLTGLSKEEFMAKAVKLLEQAFDEDAVFKTKDDDGIEFRFQNKDDDGIEFRFRVGKGSELFALADELNA